MQRTRRTTRSSLTTANPKPVAHAAAKVGQSTRPRQAFKDITNNGRVRQFTKTKKPVGTRKRSTSKSNSINVEHPLDDNRSFKKRRSEPESDPMQIDEMELSPLEDVPIYQNIDLDENGFVDQDPQAVAEYVDDIHKYMRSLEVFLIFQRLNQY